MGGFFSKPIDPFDRILRFDHGIYIPYDGSLQEFAEFTPEYAFSCKKFYSRVIRNGEAIGECNVKKGMYVELPCMLPPMGRTFKSKTGEECTSLYNNNNELDIAFIRNHQDYSNCDYSYVTFRPVFNIIQTILQEMGKPYTIHFERIAFNYDRTWKEDNAMLRILFVHGV
jgi:hypothetical protein